MIVRIVLFLKSSVCSFLRCYMYMLSLLNIVAAITHHLSSLFTLNDFVILI